MLTLSFLVQGSDPQPYTVKFGRIANHLKATCTCAAGGKGQYCKHRFNLLSGDVTNLVSHNTEDVKKLPEMLAGSDVEEALQIVAMAESELEAAQKRLRDTKHRLARIMVSSVVLLIGIAGTGIAAGQTGNIIARQENGWEAGEQGTLLAHRAVLVRLIDGGEAWVRHDEITVIGTERQKSS